VAINNHEKRIHDTTLIFNRSWANSSFPLFRGRLLLHMAGRRRQLMEISFTSNPTLYS
jgi:hypothetical protein